MENSLYIGLSKQVVLRENMEIVANNVANVNTPGYRAQNMVFDEYIADPRHMEEDISMVLDYGQYQMTDPGALKDTGNPLDIALVGKGFLGIQAPDGNVKYTRAGNLTQDLNGALRNARGMAVMADNGDEITIPEDAKTVTIDQRGTVSTEQGEIGRLMIMEFDNDQELNPAGDGLYETTAQGRPSEKTAVKQGMLEGSNVQAVVEMTRMIEVLREYQTVQNIMQSEHERLRTAAQKLGRVSA